MSIQPPSDIVLDVAQAADPAKSMAAAQKLMRAASPDDANAAFSNALENVSTPLDNTANLKTQLGLMNAHAALSPANPDDVRAKAYKGLEALVFQNLFETTLPHDTSLGPGMAGDVWRSMMAEQLGKQTAKMIDLGLFPKSEETRRQQANKALVSRPVTGPSLTVAPDSDTTGSSS